MAVTAMPEITPRIDRLDDGSDARYAKYSVEPLERGYGTTLGNALRRVLLASIPGAAITAVRVEGALHEFATLPGVVEDATELVLNLKEVAVRVDPSAHVQEPLMLRIQRRGKGEVTAADIEAPPEAEVVNKDHHIATIDSDRAVLNLELEVRRGMGYLPSEEQDKSQHSIGTIPMDAIFSPVLKVGYRVEPTRVGRRTDYDRLVLEVLTDGTIAPGQAISEAAKTLDRYLLLFFDFAEQEQKPALEERAPEGERGVLEMRVEDLDLSVRALNCLRREGVATIGQLVQKTEEEMLAMRAFGRGSLQEVQSRLAALGLSLAKGPAAQTPESPGGGQ
jgi:DNA-directed RNA polymerase subunit alpha